ncbi:FeoB-associated Cys-rich membrane protein [Treponema sp.]|nr:FeoB-associated Cys-rich membrane protein [Treponema sp.]MBE6355115.1 FeoB-associated Cys-rich membrane protein [Treponema sp.]
MWGTFFVSAVLVLLVASILISMHKKKRSGQNACHCGGNCGSCGCSCSHK